MKINVIHKEMTDEEEYQKLKEDYKKYPRLFMKPSEWKRLRLIELKKQGLVWSR